jgi:hypothetical protein
VGERHFSQSRPRLEGKSGQQHGKQVMKTVLREEPQTFQELVTSALNKEETIRLASIPLTNNLTGLPSASWQQCRSGVRWYPMTRARARAYLAENSQTAAGQFRYQYARASWGIIAGMRQKRFCGARTRRGSPCQCKAIQTKRGAWRCKLHGGLSTGPITAEGRARISAAMRARWSLWRSYEIASP